MSNPLASYLGQQPLFKVLLGLHLSDGPMHLRGLAQRFDLSPAGVSDILQRLATLGVLKESKRGNRRYVSLTLSPEDLRFLDQFSTLQEEQLIAERVERYERRAAEKLAWMDEAFTYFRRLRAKRDHTIKAS